MYSTVVGRCQSNSKWNNGTSVNCDFEVYSVGIIAEHYIVGNTGDYLLYGSSIE